MLFRITVTVVTTLALQNFAIAQTHSISGKVTDSTGNMLAYATINIYQAGKFTTPLKSSYTDKGGLYKFTAIDTGKYDLVVSFAGYEAQKRLVIVNGAAAGIIVQDIILSKDTKVLEGVTVIAQKKLIEVKDDGISYNAEADPMAASEKAIDLLRKTPMVSVDPSGKIEINGQSNFKVLLNGRETSLFSRNASEALKYFPGNLIKRIDVITNPSAKYDAEGIGGIINIITKKKVLGYNGSYNAGVNFVRRSQNTGLSLNIKYGKIGFTGTIVFAKNDGNQPYKNLEVIQPKTPLFFYKRTQSGTENSHGTNKSGNMEISYEMDSLNTFSIYGSLNANYNEGASSNYFSLVLPALTDTIKSTFNTTGQAKDPTYSTGLDYIHKFKGNLEKEFSVKIFGLFGNNTAYNTSEQFNPSSARYVINDNKARDRQYTLQVDYIHPLKNGVKLETGAKTILRWATSNYKSLAKFNPADSYQPDPQNSDLFSYRQNVYSVYSSLSFKIKKISYRFGLRMEHTEVNGDFATSQTIVSQSYTKLIPNLLFSTKLKNGHNISLGYNMRLNRPYIYDLNPYTDNTDSLSVTKGNPNLKSQIFHTINFQYRINGNKLFTSISLSNSFSNSNIIFAYYFNPATGISTFTRENNGTSNLTSINVSINANPKPQWRLNTNGRVGYYKFSDRLTGVKNAGFTGSMTFNTSYELSKKISLSGNTSYYFPVIALQGTRNGYANYGISSQFKFLESKIVTGLALYNFFMKEGYLKRVSTFEDFNFSRQQEQFVPFRYITLNLTWNFGKLSDNVSKKRGVQNNDLL